MKGMHITLGPMYIGIREGLYRFLISFESKR